MKSLLFFLPAFMLGIAIPLLLVNHATKSDISPSPTTTPTIHTRFSLANAPADSLRGSMSDFIGEVSWESRTATIPAILTEARQIQQGEILRSGGKGQVTVTFANACSVDLAPDTEVNFAQTLPSNIVLEQPAGTTTIGTYCGSPISLRSMHLLIKQMLGEMTVTADEVYATVRVSVASGSAQVAYNDSDNVSTVLTVNKGETLKFDDDTRTTVTR